MSVSADLITVRHGESELVLAPGTGGCVVSFRRGGLDLLRPGSEASVAEADPRSLAGFPLFPFSGRIANARFGAASREITLRANFPPEPHAIHGQAWQGAWRVSSCGEAAATLTFDYGGDGNDWPWSYRALQRFELNDTGLSLALSLRNLSDTPMPAGLGWHPYFRKADASIQADVLEIWRNGGDSIPRELSSLEPSDDLRETRAVGELDLDNAFRVGERPSVLQWRREGLQLSVAASPELGHLAVFTPPNEDYFCVEPVSHAPNAVNSQLAQDVTGLRWLRQGESLAATIRLTVEILDALV
jgi:aldose 1-epimerase